MSRLLQNSIRPTQLVLFESTLPHLQFSCSSLWNSWRSRLFFIGRILRREPALTQFETAQIANLCPADTEEAKSVVPRYVRGLFSLEGKSHSPLHLQSSKDWWWPTARVTGRDPDYEKVPVVAPQATQHSLIISPSLYPAKHISLYPYCTFYSL